MSPLQNDRFLKALMREPVDQTPVWMMRQAGRHLPEYRQVRQTAGSFMDLCTNPELATEVTMQPLERYPLDAAILFSDILTIPDAMGLGLYFETGEGPKFKKTISTEADVAALNVINPHKDLTYVIDAVASISRELNGRVPLIGFSGSPWTLATYMVEGGSSKGFHKTKALIYNQPEVADQLLDVLADSVIVYLNAQIEAGAQAVQIFDSWGGALSHDAYIRFSLNPMKKIINGLKREHNGRKVPVIMFTKGGGQWLNVMADSGADCLGLDWTTDLGMARNQVGNQVSLQGNMDPSVLLSNPTVIRHEVERILASYGAHSGHVFNLGHGITPDVKPESAKVFVESVGELSQKYHANID